MMATEEHGMLLVYLHSVLPLVYSMTADTPAGEIVFLQAGACKEIRSRSDQTARFYALESEWLYSVLSLVTCYRFFQRTWPTSQENSSVYFRVLPWL